jgi:hypothetical protein
MTIHNTLRRNELIVAIFVLLLSTSSNAQSLLDTDRTRPIEFFGFRTGIGIRPIAPGADLKPVFDGYYEVPAGPVLVSYDVMVSFRNFTTIDDPFSHNVPDYVLDSYGFHGNLRWLFNSDNILHPFVGLGLGFDAYQDPFPGHVSMSLPVMLGGMLDLTNSSALEIAGRATPLLYLGHGMGFSYGLTAGLRFSNPFTSILGPHSSNKEIPTQDSTIWTQNSAFSTQDTALRTVDWGRVGLAAGSLALGITALHIYQLNAWWANERTDFHVIEDDDYQHNFDKAGHMFGGYYSSYFFDQAYRWAGLDTTQSALFGALSGALWEFYVEIEDGFASGWGFSRGDAKADIAGASLYLLNQRVPFLRYFKYKWSYFPSEKYLKDQPDLPGEKLNFIEDYTGQSYWMTMDVHSMLKDAGIQPIWPRWLNLAVGISGSGLGPIDLRPGHDPYDLHYLTWLVSLDYDFSKIIPESSSGFWNFIRRSLDYWHFPAPAWEFAPQHRFFVLFPLQMTIG